METLDARQTEQKRLTSAVEDYVHQEKVLTSKLAVRQSSVRNFKDSVDKESEGNRLAEAQLDAERANVARLREDLAVTKDTKDKMMEELTLRLRTFEDWKMCVCAPWPTSPPLSPPLWPAAGGSSARLHAAPLSRAHPLILSPSFLARPFYFPPLTARRSSRSLTSRRVSR